MLQKAIQNGAVRTRNVGGGQKFTEGSRDKCLGGVEVPSTAL